MSLPKRAVRLGEMERSLHPYVTSEDRCYFLGEYLSSGGMERETWKLSAVNQLISNFKKSLSHQNTSGWHYKRQAIATIARAFAGIGNWQSIPKMNVALVPMPPSAGRADPLFDSRMLDVLQEMVALTNCRLDVRDCLSFSGRYKASHLLPSGLRPSIDQLFQDLSFCQDKGKGDKPPSEILLFDDVLTTGRHFKAAQKKLLSIFPETTVSGMFIARRVFPPVHDDFEDLSDIL